ncbi:MAG: calcium/sodium antiporter [Balneolaceae bacterium]|nr:calcium/sodium antiporter [Balneolaceae bacterium]
MLIPLLWFIVGLIALITGAELLVRYISKIALKLGISKLIIALTVVAFGTSAPELAVSVQATVDGQTDLMLGNIIGSNISNTLLILGLSALFIPLKVHKSLIKSDVPIMIGITILLYFLSYNGALGLWECILLVTLLVTYLLFLARKKGDVSIAEIKSKKEETGSMFLNVVLTILGFVLLITGARWLISSSLIFAEMAGVSELIIGLTVVAIGTSLPEIVISLVAAFRGERDIAVGNVVGSNILNILAVLGFAGIFSSEIIPIQQSLLEFDFIVLIAASIACLPIFYTGHKIVRWEGGIFLMFYFAYLFYLFLSSTEHQFIEVFINFMLFFVLPLTVLTILYHTIIEWNWRRKYVNLFKSKDQK